MADLTVKDHMPPEAEGHDLESPRFPRPTYGYICRRCEKIPIELFLFGSAFSSNRCRGTHTTENCMGEHDLRCDGCAKEIPDGPHYRCGICRDNNYNLCSTCRAEGRACLDKNHKLRKMVFENRMIKAAPEEAKKEQDRVKDAIESMQPYLLSSSIEGLAKSADAGCHMCSVIRSRVDMIPPQFLESNPAVYIECKPLDVPESFVFVAYKLGGLVEDTELDAMADWFTPQALMVLREGDKKPEPGQDIALAIPFKIEGPRGHFFSKNPRSMCCGMDFRQISPMAGHVDSLQVVRKWVSDCRKNEKCSAWPKVPFVPTRLVNVGAPRDGEMLRIVDGSSIGLQIPEYVTLSYCWGTPDHPAWMTTQANLSSRTDSLPFDILPKTIADAVEVTRAAGFRYLWVDSLCIVQDDEDDWRREAKFTKQVYTGSQFTIISGSEDAMTGLFLPRKQLEVSAVDVTLASTSGIIEPHRVTVFPLLKPVSHFDKPTTRRAWCLQEELLSPRRLYFTEGEFLWECACSTHDETGTRGPDDSPKPHDGWYTPPPYPTNVLTYDSKVVGEWYSIVEEYTARQLTRHSDVYAALGGLAGALLDKYGEDFGDRYCAGLWLNDVMNGIVWQRIDPCTLDRPDAVAGEGSAPSWSWLSVKGQVLFTRGRRTWQEEDAELVACEATTCDGDDEFGCVTSGTLRLRARLLRCSVTRNMGSEEAELAKLENIKQSLPVHIYRPGEDRAASELEGGEKEPKDNGDGDQADEGNDRDCNNNDIEGGSQLVFRSGPWEIPPTFNPAPPRGRMDLVGCLMVHLPEGAAQQEVEKVGEQKPFASVFFDDEEAANLSEVYCAYIGAINRRENIKERNGIALVKVASGEDGGGNIPAFRRVGMVAFWDKLIGDDLDFLMNAEKTEFITV